MYDIRRTELEYSRTVCAHSECVKFVPVGFDKVQNTVYKKPCHDKCTFSGIPTETQNRYKLRWCKCVPWYSQECKQCGHHYSTHLHITYDSEIIETEFLTPADKKKIKEKESIKDREETLKHAIETKIAELKEEEKVIMRIAAMYGSYLKATALIPYNDAVGDYLDMCIEHEKMKPEDIRNKTLLSKMQDMRNEYKVQRRILDSAIGTDEGENIRTPGQVKQLQIQLFKLKHFGATLERLFEGISIANSTRNRSFVEKIAHIHPEFSSKNGAKGNKWHPSKWKIFRIAKDESQ